MLRCGEHAHSPLNSLLYAHHPRIDYGIEPQEVVTSRLLGTAWNSLEQLGRTL